MTTPENASVAGCPDCAEQVVTNAPNDVVAFYRCHHAVTGHDVAWERSPDTADVPATAELTDTTDRLATDTGGAPLCAVSAAMSRRGWTVGETLSAVHDHRLAGELWEPRDDHVGVV
ncbi:hypothetical protein [Haloplanus sp.]|uniref:hypothetical protein n=1 Tax=Haloplanus sp. TaxID=1961696 RepID=UPI00262D2DBC|nr:hypothetical protein [Haloplanus sp.]